MTTTATAHGRSFVGYSEFSTLAALHQIHIRTGCFCNPGACQLHLGLSTNDLLHHMDVGTSISWFEIWK
jgi:molybdenum cofactor sulfurtransferase